MNQSHSGSGFLSVPAAPRRARSFPGPVVAARDTTDMDADEWMDWFDALPESRRVDERDTLVLAGVRAGLTLQAVGDLYGISRERIRQICVAQGVATRDIRAQQRQQAERRARRMERHIFGLSLSYPELSISELADWAETDESTIRSALGHRVHVHEVRENSWSERTSNEELLDALRRWAAQTATPTSDDYEAWAESEGLPGKQTHIIRFGGWNKALTLAGLTPVSDRGGLRPVISDEELWASVLQFFRSDSASFTFRGYGDFASSHGFPSGATVRNRLGTWSEIKSRIRLLLRYAADRDGRWDWAESVLAVIPGEAERNEFTPEDALESLNRVAAVCVGPLTVQSYEDARSDTDVPANLVQRRWGSWVNALKAAGLTERMSAKARGKLQARNYLTT